MAKCAIIFSLWLSIFVYPGILAVHASLHPPLYVPALYIFGDSTADVGTNNYIPECLARADVPPYGIDLPKPAKPTGRFSNGYNTMDHIAQVLGFNKSPPPFLSFSETNISEFLLRNVPSPGINFASGGSGLLDHTGQIKWRKVISFKEQVQQFSSVRTTISELLGANAVEKMSKSLFLISVGSNDMFEHFDAKRTSHDPTLSTGQNYITCLISTYETHLRNLYALGARKFGIISVGVIGCVPIQSAKNSGECLDAMNVDAQLFYAALQDLLQKLSSEYKGFMYALGNAYVLSEYIVEHPGKSVFTELEKACCGKGILNGQKSCRPNSDLCVHGERQTYFFWDQYHPTQTTAQLTAYALIIGQKPLVEPMSFGTLALLP